MSYTFKDSWHYYGLVRNFNAASQADKDETIAFFLQQNSESRYYWYIDGVTTLIKAVPQLQIKMELAKAAFSKTNYNASKSYGLCKLLAEIMPYDSKNEIRELVVNSEDIAVGKLSLMYEGITIEQEANALRFLAHNKNCPDGIYQARYTPRIEALKELPSVGRLKSLESLLSNNHLAYNIFEQVGDGEEFKTLLFGSVLRHRERAEVIWKKYQESVNLGTPGTVTLKGNCGNCGQFELTLKSSRTRTSVGFQRTNLSRYIYKDCCILCGGRMPNAISIDAEESLLDAKN